MYNPTKPYKHKILRLIEDTWDTPYLKVRRGVYPIFTKKFSGFEIQHTDGIGTKGFYHWNKKTLKNAVIDVLAMNLNDLALAGAVPYAVSDHITIPDDGEKHIIEIVKNLSSICKKYKIAIVGGETSHHDNTDALDISITMSGFVPKIRENQFRVGDVLVGLKSNGLHSNGFTKVRSMFRENEWRDAFIQPTVIYLNTILDLLEKYEIHGMMHITGGAFTKLKDLLIGADAEISTPNKLSPRPIFHELYKRGISDEDMYRTFNCGVGFILSASEKDAKEIVASTPHAAIIGRVVKGKGLVCIQSAFSGRTIVL